MNTELGDVLMSLQNKNKTLEIQQIVQSLIIKMLLAKSSMEDQKAIINIVKSSLQNSHSDPEMGIKEIALAYLEETFEIR
ncbi:hypothetical protein ACOY9N_06630 [Enterobacter bugandensis]|uniref:hypothetical protein n=1 Tax=Enterobacter bugandensis TaxID=881260 RepID=UPI003BD954D4